MIGFLSGTVAGRDEGGCLLDVGGVGYRLSCSTTTLRDVPQRGRRCRLFTHLQVREDALALYGFATEGERALFVALMSVSGVGPKAALALCSAFAPDSFRRALVSEDVDALASVPGIGKKTARRIVLDLKEKLSLPDLDVVGSQSDAVARARSALENLGYSTPEVRTALGEIEVKDGDDVDDVVRSALRVLAS